jgi:glucose dehydrogenase
MAYDPDLNLFYYGTANPSTWNPAQRAGPDGKPIDQKWSMTHFARNPDTGVAAWAHQMTPFDEWDYDGINEPILADVDVKGEKRKVEVQTSDRIAAETAACLNMVSAPLFDTASQGDPGKGQRRH